MTKTSVFSNGIIWFGASVSIAEILTGALLAPLGFWRGFAAIITGHLIGCALFYFAGLIGAKTGKSAMETVKMPFGGKGALLFASLNIIQLVGWTAVMIVTGASSAAATGIGGFRQWWAVMSILILIWLIIGIRNLTKVNFVSVSALFVLTLVLGRIVFSGEGANIDNTTALSFGNAVELSAVMPLSWLPLVSDYTRIAEKPALSTFVSAAVYFFGSSFMYAIGLGAAIFVGETDIAAIMLGAGIGIAGLFIIVFSTVTTTYLDAYSGGVSAVSISYKINEKAASIVILAAGAIVAFIAPMGYYESFLYFISSVFAPMAAVLLTNFYILKKDFSNESINIPNLCVWGLGFIIYRALMQTGTPFGSTLPVMLITAVLCAAVSKIKGGMKNV